MSNVVSLFNFSSDSEDQFYPFVVFKTCAKKEIYALSSRSMRLAEDIYCSDMSVVESYWGKISKQCGLSANALFENLVEQEISSWSVAVFCQHPFQGLVFLNHLLLTDSKGVYKTNSLFSKKIYSNMSWHPWTLAARQLDDCFEKNKQMLSARKSFLTYLNRFERFVLRIGVKEFSGLDEAKFYEIQRRFGGFMGHLWKWSFPDQRTDKKELTLFDFSENKKLADFPWVAYEYLDKPQRSHFLEYPVSVWDNILVELKSDFNFFLRISSLRDPVKIVSFYWKIRLFDMQEYSIPIYFKHPISLHEDAKTEYKVCLSQFHFAFENLRQQIEKEHRDLDLVNIPLVLGWDIEVSEQIVPFKSNYSILKDVNHALLNQNNLEDIQNKVQGSFKRYRTKESFIPSLDFEEGLEALGNANSNYFLRPFSILPQPISLGFNQIVRKRFLERTSSDWWNQQDENDSYRDYYICELRDKNLVSAYRNYKGEWYQHGIYS